jgi:hypothetical protein
MGNLADKLKGKGVQMPKTPERPVWGGPSSDGITFSLLSRFLVCRERFRALVVEGLRPVPDFNHKIEYGQMWHTCEEAVANELDWRPALIQYVRELGKRYKTAGAQIDHWYNVCCVQFPLYLLYIQNNPEVTSRKALLGEKCFSVPYTLPSGRVVVLRGKWDSVDVVGPKKDRGLWLQENKTKGDIKEVQIERQLKFDLQTMMYMVALEEYRSQMSAAGQLAWTYPLKGVRYNVVRRPLSGGKGTIKQCKGESKQEFYERVGSYIKGNPKHYFMRWDVDLYPHDLEKFKHRCLNPILEQLCDWWQWAFQSHTEPIDHWNWSAVGHWQHPFGVYNVLDEGGSSDLDNYLESGTEIGLARTTNLYPELT